MSKITNYNAAFYEKNSLFKIPVDYANEESVVQHSSGKTSAQNCLPQPLIKRDFINETQSGIDMNHQCNNNINQKQHIANSKTFPFSHLAAADSNFQTISKKASFLPCESDFYNKENYSGVANCVKATSSGASTACGSSNFSSDELASEDFVLRRYSEIWEAFGNERQQNKNQPSSQFAPMKAKSKSPQLTYQSPSFCMPYVEKINLSSELFGTQALNPQNLNLRLQLQLYSNQAESGYNNCGFYHQSIPQQQAQRINNLASLIIDSFMQNLVHQDTITVPQKQNWSTLPTPGRSKAYSHCQSDEQSRSASNLNKKLSLFFSSNLEEKSDVDIPLPSNLRQPIRRLPCLEQIHNDNCFSIFTEDPLNKCEDPETAEYDIISGINHLLDEVEDNTVCTQ